MVYKSFNAYPGLECYHQYDEHGFMVVQGDPKSINDSGGRNALFYKATGFPALYHRTLYGGCMQESFTDEMGNYHYEYRRHPSYEWGTSDMSRDHVTYMFILAYFGVQDGQFASVSLLRKMVNRTKYRISPKTTFTPDMWCWMKALLSHRWARLFYMIEIPWMKFMSRRNSRLIKKGDFGPELPQWVFDAHYVKDSITPEQSRIRKRIYPFYSLQILAWQTYCLSDTKNNRKLKKIILGMTTPGNLLVRLLCDDKTVTQQDVLDYHDMANYRWGVCLNNLTSRDCYMLPESAIKYNRLETDLVITIWNEKHPDQLIAA